ncbi:MAG: tripartite tricarboxylate transporter substrate binding protein [Betaproteobacteria bacterium]|nr:tripartite tricarboxylate transporter substrate binding protein [Betaproteobacteria bacterium]
MKSVFSVVRMFGLGMLVAFSGYAAAQQAYPHKPIRFISPFSPGGGTTTVARLIGQKMTESWGQYVIVDNRPGGNTIIGSEALVRSAPDGYTIMIHASTHAINPSLFVLPYDTTKDFAPVASVTSNEYMLVLHPSVPANNFQEFIALAKSMPGKLNYATTGTGSTQHLATELLSIMTGIKMQHIPYKGGGPVMTAVVGGEVMLAFTGAHNSIPHLKVGRLKAIAISGEARLPALPQLPTFTDVGLRGFDVRNWYGVFAPAGTPKHIIDKLSTEIAKIMAKPDMEIKLAAIGLKPFVTTPEQFAALIKVDIAKYARVIKTAKIKLEN